MYDNYEKRF